MTDTNTVADPDQGPAPLIGGNVKDATEGMKSSDLWQVPFEQLYIIPGYNVREDTEAYRAHLDWLTQQMIENGYDRNKPMGGYVLMVDGVSRIGVTAGHSRYIAVGRARAAGKEILTIPVVTTPRGTNTQDLIVDLVTSNQGRELTPYEVGTVCKRLISSGMDEKAISTRLGRSQQYISDLLTLHEAPQSLRDLVRHGTVSATLAIETIKKHGAEDAIDMLNEGVEVAKAAGKTRVSAKHVADDWSKACKKNGPAMFELLVDLTKDSGFGRLTKGAQNQVEEMLASLPKKPKAKKAKA
jgi:ParB-like chromosome segregation protein Spo0J